MSGGIKGWCPGALRPMLTGDGWLVRVKPRCGILAAGTALEIAGCAAQFGNGFIELTSRANLQLRGVRGETLVALQHRLAQLALLDADAAVEARRNIIASPLAGHDPTALLDIRPVVAALELALAQADGLEKLPGKFGFVVGDGGRFALEDIAGDVRFLAQPGPVFAVYAAGRREAIGACAPEDAAEIGVALACAFPGRALAARPPGLLGFHRANASAAGKAAPKVRGPGFIAIGKPFGRWQAAEWRALALAALHHAGPQAELRLTPWRDVLIPLPETANAEALAAQAAALGGILNPADSRLKIAACPGRPACASATTVTQSDALAFAELLPAAPGIVLHVSGCAKGCARAQKSPVTLVARDGLYDLVLDGNAKDCAILTHLTPAQAAQALRRWAGGESLIESQT